MTLNTLYSRTNTGAIQTWTVEVLGGKYRTIHGQFGGKLQTTEWTECIITNEGRANERNTAEQAYFEARAMWQKKKDTGYFENMNDIDISLYVEPMLAKKWVDRKAKVKFPVYCQPKYDGLRAIITRHGAKSRNGKDWVTIPHILKALKPVFEKHPNLILDGELYNHDLKEDFNKITSLVKKTKPTEEDLDESAKVVQFWWYDIADDTKNFKDRYDDMLVIRLDILNFVWSDLAKCPVKIVPTFKCDSLKELDRYYENFLNVGYEGQMIRLDTPYEFKRSSNLLKRKEFEDAEYQIIDILEGTGNRSGMAGAMVFVNELDNLFNSNIKGDRAYLKELWENKNDYIGKKATVRYFNLTPDKKIPRFPYVYGISPDKN